MNVYDVTQVLKQCINIKMVCPSYIREYRNTKFHLFQVYLERIIKCKVVVPFVATFKN